MAIKIDNEVRENDAAAVRSQEVWMEAYVESHNEFNFQKLMQKHKKS